MLKKVELKMRDLMDNNIRIKKNNIPKLIINENIATELYNKYSKLKAVEGYSSINGAVRQGYFEVYYKNKIVKISPIFDRYLKVETSKKISKNLYSNDFAIEYFFVN